MSEEATEDKIPDNQESQQNNEDQGQQPQKTFTKEEVDALIKERAFQKEMEYKRKNEKMQKHIEDLERKVKAGTATHAEQTELSAGKTAQANAQQNGIPPEALPYIMDEKMADVKFKDKLNKATETDSEFKRLATSDESTRLVNPDQMHFMRDLENSPAVLKKLLTDKKENNLMQAKFQEMIAHNRPSIFVEYMNSLSEKLEMSAVKPRASSYTPDAELSDFGDSSQDFDLKKYISGHR